MLYTGKEEKNIEGHEINVNNNMGPVTVTKGQKVLFYFVCIITLGLFLILKLTKRNTLNRMQMKINESASGIDVQLQKRFDTLNKLVQAASSQAKFDKETLETISAYRSGANKDMSSKNQAVDKIQAGINMAFEAYPTLGADDAFKKMMNESTMIEKEIAASRRLYNSNVTSFNSIIYTFPTNVIISKEGYAAIPLFSASDVSKKDVNLKFTI